MKTGLGIIRDMEIRFQGYSVELIDRDEELPAIVDWAERQDSIAIDTESNSLFVYFEKVCLVQLSAGGRNVLLDPVRLETLEPFRDLFASERIEKIFHAGEYDILGMKRDFGFEFANVFDTMIAARILGYKEIGLGSLLGNAFGIALNKKYQKANWGKRPLSEKMIEYAAGDTMHLRRLRDLLAGELSARDLSELAREDFLHLCETRCGSNRPNEATWWRVAKTPNELTRREAIRLQALVSWRELIAEREDLPTYWIARNEVLTELAIHRPLTIAELRKIRGVGETLIRKHAKSLLRTLRAPLDTADLVYPEARPLPSPSVLNRRQTLRDWRKGVGLKYDVPSDVILPKDVMERIIAAAPETRLELDALMSDYPWRRDRFSEEIFAELRRENVDSWARTELESEVRI